MTDEFDQLDRFLTRVHLRWSIARALERIGIGLMIGCGVALILSGILIYRGDSALGLIWVCLAVGVMVGGIIGLITRPTRFDAATEVDRQLKLADLLATALSIRQSRTVMTDGVDGQWSRSILAIATARCAAIDNESLILRRFGVRVWSGIGLSTAIVLTMGMLSTNPLVLQARSGHVDSTESRATDVGNPQRNPAGNLSAAMTPANPEPPSLQFTQINSHPTEQATGSDSSLEASNATHLSGASTNGSGSGAGRTNQTPASSPLPDASGRSSSESSSGDLSSGGGRAATQGAPAMNESISSSTETSPDSSRPTPPWNRRDWPDAQDNANLQLRQGHIPDAYRDLVQAYFAR